MRYLLFFILFASCVNDSEYFTKQDLKGTWSGGYVGLDMEIKFSKSKCVVTAFRESGEDVHEATYSFAENQGLIHFENNSITFEVIEHSSGELILITGDARLYKTN